MSVRRQWRERKKVATGRGRSSLGCGTAFGDGCGIGGLYTELDSKLCDFHYLFSYYSALFVVIALTTAYFAAFRNIRPYYLNFKPCVVFVLNVAAVFN